MTSLENLYIASTDATILGRVHASDHGVIIFTNLVHIVVDVVEQRGRIAVVCVDGEKCADRVAPRILHRNLARARLAVVATVAAGPDALAAIGKFGVADDELITPIHLNSLVDGMVELRMGDETCARIALDGDSILADIGKDSL